MVTGPPVNKHGSKLILKDCYFMQTGADTMRKPDRRFVVIIKQQDDTSCQFIEYRYLQENNTSTKCTMTFVDLKWTFLLLLAFDITFRCESQLDKTGYVYFKMFYQFEILKIVITIYTDGCLTTVVAHIKFKSDMPAIC